MTQETFFLQKIEDGKSTGARVHIYIKE